MELKLTRLADMHIHVRCNGISSHTFDLYQNPIFAETLTSSPFYDPIEYGRSLYQMLFPDDSLTSQALQEKPERLLLVSTDPELDAFAWEYAYGPHGFLALALPFLRTLPAEQRIDPPSANNHLHIIAVPSNPLEPSIPALNIDGEWERLKEIVQEVSAGITLERTRPPTLEQLRRLVANQQQCVVHFMGHGEQRSEEAALLFENEHGGLHRVPAHDFVQRLRENVFLVTLNACVSAAPGSEDFSNLAAALMQQGVPYVLGMRSSITDHHARLFSRIFYSELARGTTIEEAVRQVRVALAEHEPQVVGIPILYTALKAPASGFVLVEGRPSIDEHQPPIEISVLPQIEGIFQGHSHELQEIGKYLTDDSRPRLLTLHGPGGSGKTALARRAIERFAFAWPGGVWATSMEHLPNRELFVTDLARFLGLSIQEITIPQERERQVLARLEQYRTLLVLDNAETLVEAIEAGDTHAVHLAQFLQEMLPYPPVSLLATSRTHLGWSSEQNIEIHGLLPDEGAILFLQQISQRQADIVMAQARILSQHVGGHPLSLRLLGAAFDASTSTFAQFIEEYEIQLLETKNIYKEKGHRQGTIYACVEMSVRSLSADERALFSGLWIFHDAFLPETAMYIFHAIQEDVKGQDLFIYHTLQMLWKRGLLMRETDHGLPRYRLLPVIRFYIERYMQQVYPSEKLLPFLGQIYAEMATQISARMNDDPAMIFLALQSRRDLERGIAYVNGPTRGYYLLEWGWVLDRLGDIHRSRVLTEQALELAQSQEDLQVLQGRALNNLATFAHTTGQPQRAIILYEKALAIWHATENTAGEALTLNDMASVYKGTGQFQQALAMHEKVLPLRYLVGDQRGEAITLGNIAAIWSEMGLWQRAIELYEQSLRILRLVGDRQVESSTLTNMALLYQQMGQTQQALKIYKHALHLRRAIGDLAGEAMTLNNLSEVYRVLGQPQEVLSLLKQALSIIRSLEDTAAEITILHNISCSYAEMGQQERAIDLYEQLLPRRREVGDRVGEAATYNNLGWLYMEREQYQQALKCCEQALSLQQATGNRLGEAKAIGNVAAAYQKMGKEQQAMSLYKQSLEVMHELGDREGEAATLTNIALVHQNKQHYQEALTLLEQALVIQREISYTVGEAVVLKGIAAVYQAMKQLQPALEYYEQALALFSQSRNKIGQGTIFNNMAEIYMQLSQPQRAMNLYEQALTIQREIGNQAQEVITLTNMAGTYEQIGEREHALDLYVQALHITRKIGNREHEATILLQQAGIYCTMGQFSLALEYYEQALLIIRETGDHEHEANALNGIGGIYQTWGQLQTAMDHYQQALLLVQKAGDQKKEAALLNRIAWNYQSKSEFKQALDVYQQGLRLVRSIGNREGEAGTLNYIAEVFRTIGQWEQALTFYQEALTIQREMKDRKGEAAILNNIALLYRQTQQPLRALEIYEQILPLWLSLGDRLNETHCYNNMGTAYCALDQPQKALELYQKALNIRRESAYKAGEATTLCNIAAVLYLLLDRSEEAIIHLEQAIAILIEHDLPCNTAHQTVDNLRQQLADIRAGVPPDEETRPNIRFSPKQIGYLVNHTIAVLTILPRKRDEWQATLTDITRRAQQRGVEVQEERDFLAALLALFNGQTPSLPLYHPYSSALTTILSEWEKTVDQGPSFDPELIPRSVTALSGRPQDKLDHLRFLFTYENMATDDGLKALLHALQLALLDHTLHGQLLTGIYSRLWDAIILGVETADADPQQLAHIQQSTLAALGSETGQRNAWRDLLVQIEMQANAEMAQQLAALTKALIELLDNDGKGTERDYGLKGVYEQVWLEVGLALIFL